MERNPYSLFRPDPISDLHIFSRSPARLSIAEGVALHITQRNPHVPIVLLSAYADMPEQVLWLVDEYVLKSAPLEELIGVLRRVYLASDRTSQRHAAA